MKKYLLVILLCHGIIIHAQTNYNNGNEAYIAEKLLGFNPVTINNGSLIYTYDTFNKVYQSGDYILLPDKTSIPDGKKVDVNTFYGYGFGGVISDTAFNWDRQTIFTPNDFNISNMFVSPLSVNGMSYASAIQYNSPYCNYGDCYATIDGPVPGLAYPSHMPGSGVYNIWAGEELITAGNLKGTGTIQKVSQQQTTNTTNRSYCVDKYGEGWRLPTDMEVGHFNDEEGVGVGLDSSYKGVSGVYIWTSSLYKIYTVKRWATRITDGYWENCGGFLYVGNCVRCVFPGFDNPTTAVNEKSIEAVDEINIYPNPGNGILKICNIAGFLVKIYNQQGQLVFSDNRKISDRSIDLSFCADGFYYIKISSEEKQLTKKLVINKME